uniref:Innexin n=1 Tax=Caligus clemensi TaxID=344056 RepID=C1C2B6_CALCM|nr:Innexin inx2 [Caligus clemensi]
MAHLLQDLVKFFNFDEVEIDSWNFKLFHKGTALLFFIGSLVGVLSQYFGQPISCDFKSVDRNLANDYCWIHGSSYIRPEYQLHMKCITDLEGIVSADDAPDTSYYQWVTFIMLFQAGITLFPYKIWSYLEGGLISSFGTEGRSAILLSEDVKFDEEEIGGSVLLEKALFKYVKFFRSNFHHNNLYFFQFFCCEVLNYALLIFNFWITDIFLHGKFHYYGWNVLDYYWMSKALRESSVNPFCQAFPTEVSCTVPNVGAAGGEQFHNGFCVLSQNIINEKVYLVLWFWLVFVMVLSIVNLLYRVCTICFDDLRVFLIKKRIYTRNNSDWMDSLEYVMSKCYIGDWFVLCQLRKNVNRFFFREFVKELMMELKHRPKKSANQKVNFDDKFMEDILEREKSSEV